MFPLLDSGPNWNCSNFLLLSVAERTRQVVGCRLDDNLDECSSLPSEGGNLRVSEKRNCSKTKQKMLRGGRGHGGCFQDLEICENKK